MKRATEISKGLVSPQYTRRRRRWMLCRGANVPSWACKMLFVYSCKLKLHKRTVIIVLRFITTCLSKYLALYCPLLAASSTRYNTAYLVTARFPRRDESQDFPASTSSMPGKIESL